MPRDGDKTARRPINLVQPKIPSLKELLGKAYDDKLAYAFPDVAPPYVPTGKNILVQLRTPGAFKVLPNGKKFYYTDETQDFIKYNIQTAVVRCLGPVAFRHRLEMTPFPEGEWAVPGEFVRVPKFGGDRVGVPLEEEGTTTRAAYFLMINDTDITGRVYGDPLELQGII